MPTIRAEDLAIAYEVIGAGEPLVMLHGATSSWGESFGSLVTALAESFELYLPDARGHGGTRWDASAGFRAEWLVDDLLGFVDALGLRTFHLLGYSMGAMTALEVATRAPERVRTLVVVGLAPDREPRATVTRRLLDPARLQRDQPGWAAELSARLDPVQGAGAWQRLLPAIAADVATQPLLSPSDLRAITAPTLVACGDRDPLVPVVQAAALARQVRDGRLFVAPDTGHDLLTRRPALSLEVLRTFYRSTDSLASAWADARVDGGADAPSEVPG
jgi:pimeloyl-ACP methyl ester carboxylesterase